MRNATKKEIAKRIRELEPLVSDDVAELVRQLDRAFGEARREDSIVRQSMEAKSRELARLRNEHQLAISELSTRKSEQHADLAKLTSEKRNAEKRFNTLATWVYNLTTFSITNAASRVPFSAILYSDKVEELAAEEMLFDLGAHLAAYCVIAELSQAKLDEGDCASVTHVPIGIRTLVGINNESNFMAYVSLADEILPSTRKQIFDFLSCVHDH